MRKPQLSGSDIERALTLLGDRMELYEQAPITLVVCGGAALVLSNMVKRTTVDVDVVALLQEGRLTSPAPMPAELMRQAAIVAEERAFGTDWLNNAPSSGIGGLFQWDSLRGWPTD